MDLLLWILVAYGIANGVVTSKLADPIRTWFIMRGYGISPEGKTEKKRNLSVIDKLLFKVGEMLVCMMCFGFWVGVGLHYWYSPTGSVVFDGFLSSGMCWLIHGLNYSLMLRHGRV